MYFNRTIQISNDIKNKLVYSRLSTSVGQSECSQFISTDGDVYNYILPDYTSCETTSSNNGSHILYSNTLRIESNDQNKIISRGRAIKIRFTCAIESELTVSLSNGFVPDDDEIGINLRPQKSPIHLSMDLFQDEAFSQRLDSPTIRITDMIYVGIGIEGANTINLILQAEKCWATPRYTFTHCI